MKKPSISHQHPKRFSKAQHAAFSKFAAGGRAAQAKARKAPGYKPSKAQVEAGKDFAAAGRRAQARARKGLPPLKHKLSDGVACCAAEAVANSLRLQGVWVGQWTVLDLYWETAWDPDQGATIAATLHAASHGVAGWSSRAAECHQPATAWEHTPGLVLGWDSWDGLDAHAAVSRGNGDVITWGGFWEPPAPPDESWLVTWAQ